MAKAKSVSTPIEGQSGQIEIDCTDEAKLLDDNPSNMAKSHRDGMGSERDSGNGMDTLGAPERNKDDWEWLMKLCNISEHFSEHLKQIDQKYLP